MAKLWKSMIPRSYKIVSEIFKKYPDPKELEFLKENEMDYDFESETLLKPGSKYIRTIITFRQPEEMHLFLLAFPGQWSVYDRI